MTKGNKRNASLELKANQMIKLKIQLGGIIFHPVRIIITRYIFSS